MDVSFDLQEVVFWINQILYLKISPKQLPI